MKKICIIAISLVMTLSASPIEATAESTLTTESTISKEEIYNTSTYDNGLNNNVESIETISPVRMEDEMIMYSSGNDEDINYFYNTGTSLPKEATYLKYDLLDVIKKGDIIYEAEGGYGITGHIAIVEGVFYDYSQNRRYVRIIEAIASGVKRSVLDDTRYDYKDVTILRVKNASTADKTNAVDFCISQLDKSYSLDLSKNTSENTSSWYCSELVWAAYKNQGIDIEKSPSIVPGITPDEILNSNRVAKVSPYVTYK